MKILADNNIILDVFLPNELFAEESRRIYELVFSSDFEVFICSNSLTDIYYFLKKNNGAADAKGYIESLIELFSIIPLSADDCLSAVSHKMSDFEDAIIAVCAEKAGVDYIISRDKGFLSTQNIVKVITPGEFLNFFN
ncbi:MAG: PIN domain-containing protein [Ruminococcus sp.]|jgi:predicted nucleic acid-binding protein|nr:PIN domain-containing protein [Ruminococcus sp.]